MPTLYNRLITLSICVLLFLPKTVISAPQQRIALVIGNGNYQKAPLKNPINDAADISRALKRCGFRVTVLQDVDLRAMEDAIRKFGRQLSGGGVGLFYYAGHGMQVDGRNFLIPVDARIESPSDVKYEALDAGRVLGKMEDAGNDMNIVILDACRDNPFSRSWRSGVKGLARMDAPKGSYIAYATAPGAVAADGAGRNGTYTRALLRHIEKQGLTLENVMKRVRGDVIRETGSRQVPWASTSLVGEFYFRATGADPAQPTRAVGVTKRQAAQTLNPEEEMWEMVQDSRSIEDYTLFLDEYPDSRFKGTARLKIQQLKREQKARPTTASLSPAAVKPGAGIESPGPGAGVVASDGRYAKYATGVVYDQMTGLEWYAGPDRDMSWYVAKSWVENLDVAAGGWRMPTVAEIESLYKRGAGHYNLTPFLAGVASTIPKDRPGISLRLWSGESVNAAQPAARGVTFPHGRAGQEYMFKNIYHHQRVLAVRYRK